MKMLNFKIKNQKEIKNDPIKMSTTCLMGTPYARYYKSCEKNYND